MANLDSLSLNITASTTKAVNAIGKLEGALTTLSNSLNSLNVGNLSGLTTALDGLTNSMVNFKNSGVGRADFTRLASSLNALASVNTTNLGIMGTSIASFGTALNGLNIDSKSVAGINTMATAIMKLSSVDTSTLQTNIPSIVASLDLFVNELNKLTALTVDVTPITKLVSAMARLGGADITTIPQKLEAIAKAVLDMMKAFQNAPALSASVQSILNAISSLNGANIRAVGSTNQLGISFKKLIPSLNQSKGQFKGLVSMIGMFYARCFIAIRAIKLLWKAVEGAMNVVETQNYYESSFKMIAEKAVAEMGEAGEKSAQEFYDKYTTTSNDLAKKMTGFTIGENGKLENTGGTSLGLNVREVKAYQTQYAQLASSMNVASDYAVKMSNALTMIGTDLASIKDEDFEQTWSSMASGITGMAKAVDRFGINLRQSALQEKLDALGIDARIAKLGQQDKALLRSIIILDSSRYAWADLARNIDTPSNKLKVLQANFKQLGAMLGQVFVSFVSKAMTYVNALVIALQRLVAYIMNAFHIQLPQTTAQSANGFDDLADSIGGVEDAMDGATGSVKKLKGQLLGIDELNNITTKDDSGGGAGGLDNASDALQKAFDAIYGEYQKKWDDAYKKMVNEAQNLADDIIKAVKEGNWGRLGSTIGTRLKTALDSIPWFNIYERARGFGKGIADFLNGLITPELFYSIGKTIAGYLNTEFYAIGSFVENFDWKKAGVSLASMVKGFVENVDAKYIGETVGNALDGAFKLISSFLHETPWMEVGRKIGEFLKGLKWQRLLGDVIVVIGQALVALAETTLGMILADPISGSIVVALAGAFTASKMLPVIDAIAKAMGSQTALGAFATGATPASGALAKVMNTSFGKAWTKLGGVSGILTQDLSAIYAEGSLMAQGASIGVGIAGAVVAGFVGYQVGDAIYRNLIEDTKWDAFGFDMREKMRIEQHLEEESEKLKQVTPIWNNALSQVATDLNWSALFQFEGQDVWADMVGDIDALMTQISSHGVDITDTASALDVLSQSSLDVSDASIKYVEILLNEYNSLDDTTKALLAQQYGFKNVGLSMEGVIKAGSILAENNGKLAPTVDKVKVASDGVLTSLQKQKSEIDNTVEGLKEYITANGGSYEACKQLYEAQKAQKDILQDTITELKNYQSQHGGNYQIAKQLAEAQKELNSYTDKSKESTDTATEGYNALMESFENSSLSSADFAGYMETLTEKDVPKAVEAIEDMDETVQNLSKTLPDLKDEFEKAFKQIDTDVTNASTKLIPDFETSVTNTKDNLVNVVLPAMTQGFEDTATNSTTALGKITDWYKTDFVKVFTKENVTKDIKGIEDGFSTVFSNVSKIVVNSMNKLISAINNAFDISWDAIQIDGEDVVGAGSAKLINISPIQGFANGGFVNSADLFMANENGVPELVGTIGGRGAVASGQEITGIRQAIYDVAGEIITEMRNNETRVVLEGDAKGMFRQMRNEAKIYQRSTGSQAFSF